MAKANDNGSSSPLKDKHPNFDLFVADILNATPKDDIGSMEHPMFALRAGDKAIRTYEHNGNTIEITPSVKGLATIFDKDVLIYCISQLMNAKNKDQEINKTLRIKAHDLLVSTNRPTGGDGYERLQEAFSRLRGTTIKTNIMVGNERIKEWFGLIEKVKIVEKAPHNDRMIAVEITLSDWLFNAITANEVLSINSEYFRLRKPLERRLYEIARKHCGHQASWVVNLDTLYKKTGSLAPIREFRRLIKSIINHQHLPDYRVAFDVNEDKVSFYNKSAQGNKKLMADVLKNKQGDIKY